MVHLYEAFFGIVVPFMAEFKLIGLTVELMLVFSWVTIYGSLIWALFDNSAFNGRAQVKWSFMTWN